MNSDFDGVIQEGRDGGNMRHEVVNTDIRTLGETSTASSPVIREDNITALVTENGLLDMGAGLDTGNRIVCQRGISQKQRYQFHRLKFCPTLERIYINLQCQKGYKKLHKVNKAKRVFLLRG